MVRETKQGKPKKPAFKLYLQIFSIALPILVMFLSVAFLLFYTVSPTPKVVHAKVEATKAAVLMPSPVATIAATPTPSPTPSPVYTGYCLSVPVIFYHHIQPLAEAKTQGHAQLTVDSGIFDIQMAYLVSKGYTAISAETLANALVNKTGLPPKPIVITVDDGYSDFYTYAYPILQKYHLVASLAIPTGLLGNGDYMSWDQLKQMVGSGQIFAYNHTWSHANLAGASNEKAQYEVSTAKGQLQQFLGKVSNVFFYPYGGVNNNAIAVLAANGYRVGFTTIPGSYQCDSFLMSLHRTRIGNSPLASYGL